MFNVLRKEREKKKKKRKKKKKKVNRKIKRGDGTHIPFYCRGGGGKKKKMGIFSARRPHRRGERL